MQLDVNLVIGIVALFLAVVALLYSWYNVSKENVINDIKYRLSQCRGFASWDFGSEDHLFEWMHNTEEGQLHHRNLFTLLKIRRAVWKYLHLHIEEDDKLPMDVLKKHYLKKKK